MTLSKTIELPDLELLKNHIYLIQEAEKNFVAAGLHTEIGHAHRYWEYGMAMEALTQWVLHKRPQPWEKARIVDIGAGDSLFGPCLAWSTKAAVEEIEPREDVGPRRQEINAFLAGQKRGRLAWTQGDLVAYPFPETKWDAVFCLSVVEHVREQDAFWDVLPSVVKEGGLLFLTTDVVPDASRRYHFDNLRAINYTTDSLRVRAERILEKGFGWLAGEPDWEFHGAEVFDYSFMSLAMVRK